MHKILPVPVYGIGAGADCDGQVMVINDILGMFEDFTPKFARKYADVAGIAVQVIAEYIKETKAGVFPGPDNKYKVHGEPAEFERLFAELEMEFGK